MSSLEENFAELKGRVVQHLDNEFPHFRDRMEKKVSFIIWTIIIGFLSTITVVLVTSFLLKFYGT